MSVRSGLAACGVIAAIAVAGCGSGGSGGSAASAAPSWAKALGTGVTVIAPGASATAAGSPGAVVATVVADTAAGQYAKLCKTFQPSEQSQCQTAIGGAPASSLASKLPSTKNYVVGYTAVHGDQALVGATGTLCQSGKSPKCVSNTDPAAIFDSGKSFATLWTQNKTAGSSKKNTYSLNSLVKINGHWYGY